MSKRLDEKLIGWDAARHIRSAQRDLRHRMEMERQIGDRQPRKDLPRLDVPCLLVEDAAGQWTASTTTNVYGSQKGRLEATDRTEALAIAELRQQLRDALVQDRWCNKEDARYQAANANIWAAGRVPFARIVSK